MSEARKHNLLDDAARKKLLAEVNAIRGQIHDALTEAFETRMSHWRDLLGPHLEQMLNSRAETIRMIAAEDAMVREGAFSLLAHHWGPDAALDGVCRQTVLMDPDHNVRTAAISCLRKLHVGTRNREVSCFLAAIVEDEANAPNLRNNAYLALMDVQGAPVPRDIEWEIAGDRTKVPRNLDWAMVRSFAQG